jgi:dienelactone hydrolase
MVASHYAKAIGAGVAGGQAAGPTIATVLQLGPDLEVDTALVATPAGTPLWLSIGAEPLYAVLHGPQNGARRGTAVLIVGPFGWQDIASYRARREWAIALAERGFAALRIDLPGTGDSAGAAAEPERVSSWPPAIAAAAEWLRALASPLRLAVIGIGLGGLLSVQALADGAPLDELVLWDTGSRGRSALRELRAYAGMIATGIGDAERAPAAGGELDLAGYAISPESAQALERIDLTELELAPPRPARALLIGRGTGEIDARLRSRLEQHRVEVEVDQGADYDQLVAPPQAAAVPRATIERSLSWLEQCAGEPAPAEPLRAAEVASSSITFGPAGSELRETLVSYDTPRGRFAGVLTEPAEAAAPPPVCIVLPNAGAIRRSGPNRMWTELARRAAATGVAAIRVDAPGLGDAPGDTTALIDNDAHYDEPLIAAELELLERLERAGVSGRFVAVGLCSSSYWGWHAALRDPRVIGAALINLYAFEYSRELVLERDRRRTVEVMRSGLIARLRRKGLPRAELRRALTALLSAVRRRGGDSSVEDAQRGAIADALDLLARRGTRVLLLFSRGESLLEQLERQGQLAQRGRWPNLEVERLPSRDHELRVLAVQELVNARIDALLAELSRAS